MNELLAIDEFNIALASDIYEPHYLARIIELFDNKTAEFHSAITNVYLRRPRSFLSEKSINKLKFLFLVPFPAKRFARWPS